MEPTRLRSLERRIRRCEMMMATMIAADGRIDRRSLHFLLRRLMRDREDADDRTWMMLLDEMMMRGAVDEDHLTAQLHRLRSSTDDRLGGLEADLNEVRRDHTELAQDTRELAQDTRAFLMAESLGIDTARVRLHRILPVRMYLQREPRDLEAVTDAVASAIRDLGFEVAEDFPAEEGSWWKRWWVRSKDALAREDVQERLQKLEKAAEIKALGRPQADADEVHSRAIANLMSAVTEQDNAAVQCGSVLLVKTTRGGKSNVQVRTLSPTELVLLENRPNLLQQPARILEELAEAVGDAPESGGPDATAMTARGEQQRRRPFDDPSQGL